MKNTFIHGGIPESKPAPGAIERDWTQKTLTNSIENSLGETYYFEILPNESLGNIPNAKRAQGHNAFIERNRDTPKGKILGFKVVMTLPVGVLS